MTLLFPTEIEAECWNCGEILTKDNYHGFFKLVTIESGIEIREPLCDTCIQSNDGSNSEGAY